MTSSEQHYQKKNIKWLGNGLKSNQACDISIAFVKVFEDSLSCNNTQTTISYPYEFSVFSSTPETVIDNYLEFEMTDPTHRVTLHINNLKLSSQNSPILLVRVGILQVVFSGANTLANNEPGQNYFSSYAGIECDGLATIEISDENWFANGQTAINSESNSLEIKGGFFSPGIGPGPTDKDGCQQILILNGRIRSFGGERGAGIGASEGYGDPHSGYVNEITIKDGIITSTGGKYGSGIGASFGNATNSSGVNSITVTGGTITATGGERGSGIGAAAGGNQASSCVNLITITGGTIVATGGDYGSGIGAAFGGNPMASSVERIEIKGGEIHAFGGYYGSGIGAGEGSSQNSAWVDSIVIEGGTIFASTHYDIDGSSSGASIGAGDGNGNSSWVGKIMIKGGTINSFVNSSNDLAFGASIGAGKGAGKSTGQPSQSAYVKEIEISGGEIQGSHLNPENGYGSGLGGAYGEVLDSSYVEKITLIGGRINVSGGSKAAGLGAGYGKYQESGSIGTSGRVGEIQISSTVESLWTHSPLRAIGNGQFGTLMKPPVSNLTLICTSDNTTCVGLSHSKPFSRYEGNPVKPDLVAPEKVVIFKFAIFEIPFYDFY